MNMEELKIPARAKINLSLDVCGRRPDGYHELRMIMQSLTLCDEIGIALTGSGEISLSAACGEEASGVPYDENNLMVRAARLIREELSLSDGLQLSLRKRIPVAAGLAGGSADAAAVLCGVNELCGHPLSEEALCAIGVRIGADVPYCIMGGTALSEGIGERLTKLPPAPPCRVLLVKPRQEVSTKSVYQALDHLAVPETAHPDVESVRAALLEKNLRALSERMGNLLELVTVPQVPVIEQIKKEMKARGALGAMMSGSGPTVFGLFTEEAALHAAAANFSEEPYRSLCSDVIETAFYRETAL